MTKDTWQWQEPGTAWRGVGIYHITLTVPSRQPLLGTLVIPGNDPSLARVERTELGKARQPKLPQPRGRVLILSPWRHDADKSHITRDDCVALNEIAESFLQY